MNYKINVRNYRGTLNTTVSWNEGGQMMSKEFDSRAQAEAFVEAAQRTEQVTQSQSEAPVASAPVAAPVADEGQAKFAQALADAKITDLESVSENLLEAIEIHQRLVAIFPDNRLKRVRSIDMLEQLIGEGATLASIKSAYLRSATSRSVAI
ncbi:MAG: hypothetical protein AAGC73_07780 [Verrucomicrobiota bacterium]